MCIRRDMQNVIYIYITTYKWRNNNVIIIPNVIATLFWRNGGVIVTWCVRRGGTLHHDIIIFNFTWNYLIIIYIYYYHTNIMQISVYVKNNMPEPGHNLAADACMERTQLSLCIYNFSTRTIRASRNAMSAWYFFSCWATYIQIFFGNIHNIVTTTVTNSIGVEPVSYIYIIKPTGC